MHSYWQLWLTGLGEEGREALIRVGSFALLSQVPIGLYVRYASVSINIDLRE